MTQNSIKSENSIQEKEPAVDHVTQSTLMIQIT